MDTLHDSGFLKVKKRWDKEKIFCGLTFEKIKSKIWS